MSPSSSSLSSSSISASQRTLAAALNFPAAPPSPSLLPSPSLVEPANERLLGSPPLPLSPSSFPNSKLPLSSSLKFTKKLYLSLSLSHCHSPLPPLIRIPTADFSVQQQARSVFNLRPPCSSPVSRLLASHQTLLLNQFQHRGAVNPFGVRLLEIPLPRLRCCCCSRFVEQPSSAAAFPINSALPVPLDFREFQRCLLH